MQERSGRIRIELCPSVGPNRFHVFLIAKNESLLSVAKRAAQKFKLKRGGSVELRLYSERSREMVVRNQLEDGAKYFVGFVAPPIVAVAPPSMTTELHSPELVSPEAADDSLDDVVAFLRRNAIVCPPGQRPSHIWWTPKFRPEDRFIVHPMLRAKLAVLNARSSGDSFLVEVRRSVFCLHFDFDCVVDTPSYDSIQKFWVHHLKELILPILSDREKSGLVVTGHAGPWSKGYKYGIHVYCKHVLCDEEMLANRTREIKMQMPEGYVDDLAGGGLRAFGSKKNATCKQCRKQKLSKPDPKCRLCYGEGILPRRTHEMVENDSNLIASIFPDNYEHVTLADFDCDELKRRGELQEVIKGLMKL